MQRSRQRARLYKRSGAVAKAARSWRFLGYFPRKNSATMHMANVQWPRWYGASYNIAAKNLHNLPLPALRKCASPHLDARH
jgi:hypothetical protein